MNDEDLDRILRTWLVEPDVPARFQAGVWARIASSEAARRDTFWRRISRQFSRMIVQPAYASALIVAVLGLSLGAADVHTDNVNARLWAELKSRYVSSIDPTAQAAEAGFTP